MKLAYRRSFVRQTVILFTFAPLMIQARKREVQEVSKEIEDECEAFRQRLLAAVEDSLKIVEDDIPEWLDEDCCGGSN